MKVRELEEDEWLFLRQSRLHALQADPQSYWEKFGEAQEYPDEYWIDLASNLTAPNGSRMFIVEGQVHIAGFVFGIKNSDGYRMGSLWINTNYRNQKLGSTLIKHVIDWAKQLDKKASIKLWSPMDETVNFYTKCGFNLSGDIKTHPDDGRKIVEMEYQTE